MQTRSRKFLFLLVALVLTATLWGVGQIRKQRLLDETLFSEIWSKQPDAKRVKQLLDKGADANFRNNYRAGMTVLHAATDGDQWRESGDFEVVRILVEKGAKINVQDANKETPLLYAARNGDLAIVKFLLKHNADTSILSYDGHTALTQAQNGLKTPTYWHNRHHDAYKKIIEALQNVSD